jgi:hypothetical protein
LVESLRTTLLSTAILMPSLRSAGRARHSARGQCRARIEHVQAAPRSARCAQCVSTASPLVHRKFPPSAPALKIDVAERGPPPSRPDPPAFHVKFEPAGRSFVPGHGVTSAHRDRFAITQTCPAERSCQPAGREPLRLVSRDLFAKSALFETVGRFARPDARLDQVARKSSGLRTRAVRRCPLGAGLPHRRSSSCITGIRS